ncbi:MAG: hypothetical protein RR891_02350 [Clostridium sp.]|uniref:hypothetical protein n=1 Tax=Clostridium sp. TaxID=1506 RepID=UPI003045D88C
MQLTKEGEVKMAYNVAMWFTVVSGLFIALSPQYFGFIFPVIFLIPIYMGIKALKGRRKAGLYLSLGIVPLSVSLSSIWLRYGVNIIGSGNLANAVDVSPTMFLIFVNLALFLGISCIILIVKLIKYRNVFIH